MKLLSVKFSIVTIVVLLLSACATPQVVDACAIRFGGDVDKAMVLAQSKLASGCEYQFDNYFDELLKVAANDPGPENKRRFSDFLVAASQSGIISKRQAKARYNRYFNIKFVSLTGNYNTCSQVCPVKDKVLANMRTELADKQFGLVEASEDTSSYYRADQLLQEAQLVLEATCRACSATSL